MPTALCRKTQNHSGVAKKEWDCIRFGEIESENAAYKDLDFKNPTHRNPTHRNPKDHDHENSNILIS